jgi:hypothetical protein
MSMKKNNEDKIKLKFERERKRLMTTLLNDCNLVEGSLRDLLVRCGRKGCHCEKEPVHPVTRLSRWENGKLKNKIVRVDDRELIRKLSHNYREHRNALSKLIKLNDEEMQWLKSVLKSKTVKYE